MEKGKRTFQRVWLCSLKKAMTYPNLQAGGTIESPGPTHVDHNRV